MGIKLVLITPAFAQNEENMVSVKREDIGQWKNFMKNFNQFHLT